MEFIDIDDVSDPAYCPDYAQDIIKYLRSKQEKYSIKDYLENGSQTDIKTYMRFITVDWLVGVADEYKLSSETLYLAVNYMDRYLSIAPSLLRTKFQLLGASTLLIARYCYIFWYH